MKFCPKCGTELPVKAIFCPACGNALDVAPSATLQGAPPKKAPGIARYVVMLLVAAALGIGALSIVLLSNSSRVPKTVAATTTPASKEVVRLFPGSVDAQPKDQERNHGQLADVNGVQATMRTGAFTQKISDFETDGYIVIDVALHTVSDSTHPYNEFDWRVQTPSGKVLDPTISTRNGLDSGDLVAHGRASGEVVFQVGGEKGDYYVIWKPDAFRADRGIWRVQVS